MSDAAPPRRRAEKALRAALSKLPGSGPGAEIRERMDADLARLRRKLRVAVVGRVKTGKSTLVNALIGERLAPTGVLELTFNVNHLRREPTRRVTARFTDGSEIVLDDLAALEQYAAVEQYTALRDDNRDRLRPVEWVEVVCDNPYLELFDLIDTPGLDTVFGEEAEKSLTTIGITGQHVREASTAEAREADALIIVLDDRLLSEVDEEVLAAFRGPALGDRTPVRTLGVLTKVENLWIDDVTDPLKEAERTLPKLLRIGVLHELLFEIVPVCSLVGEAAATLDADDLRDLTLLSAVDDRELTTILRIGDEFRVSEQLPLEASRRIELHRRFSPYGIHLACAEIRAGADTVEQLRTRLRERSGLDRLRKRLVDHFGHRADLIKIAESGEWVSRLPWTHRAALDPKGRTQLDEVVDIIHRMVEREPGLRELALLQRILTRRLALPAAVEREVLRVIGEDGRSVRERLDVAPEAPIDFVDLEQRARAGYDAWRLGRADVHDSAVPETLCRTYAELLTAIRAARRHLEEPW